MSFLIGVSHRHLPCTHPLKRLFFSNDHTIHYDKIDIFKGRKIKKRDVLQTSKKRRPYRLDGDDFLEPRL